jgi:hypothetical protein
MQPGAIEQQVDAKQNGALPVLGDRDLELLNTVALDYLRSLPVEEAQRRVDAISVNGVEDSKEYARAVKLLAEEGAVIVRDFLNPEQLSIADAACARISDALRCADSEHNFEDSDILVQSAKRVADNYRSMSSHPKVIVTIRRGPDAGMVDVFNIDRLAGNRRNDLRAPFVSKRQLDLINDGGGRQEATNLNLYINQGITRTRGFHVDAFHKSLKGFVYLNDITALDQGPYCFVRRSHQDGPWRKANQKISELAHAKTECPFIDLAMAVPALAPRGALVLSDQAGIHRGIPQHPNAERRVLVMRYVSQRDARPTP